MEMTRWRFYHHFGTDKNALLRTPQIGVRTPVLSHDGSDLAAALQTILEIGHRDGLLNDIEQAFNGASLIVESLKGRFSFLLRMPGLVRPLDATELSDGTLLVFVGGSDESAAAEPSSLERAGKRAYTRSFF